MTPAEKKIVVEDSIRAEMEDWLDRQDRNHRRLMSWVIRLGLLGLVIDLKFTFLRIQKGLGL